MARTATRTKTRKLTAGPISLREAIADKRLLRLSLSPRQRDLVSLIEEFGLVIAAAGRQSGKSLIAAALLVWNMLLRPDLDELTAQMTRRHGLCVANSQAQATIVLNYARNLIEQSPLLRTRLIRSDNERLLFERAAIVAMPCDRRLMRGLVASAVCLDEFAHFASDTDGPRVADAVWAAVRPSLATFGEEGRLVAISTPMGSDGLFAQLHARASSGELPHAASFTATTAEMNPRVPADFLEGERIALGEQDYSREFEAQFGRGGAGFFEEDAVRAVVGRYRELSPEDGSSWLVGFDPSFSVDPAGVAVVGRSRTDRKQLVVARVQRWIPRTGRLRRRRQSTAARQGVIDTVLDGVAGLAKTFGRAPVLTDQHTPATVIEGLKARGVARVLVRPWTAQSQTESFRALRAHVYSGTISLPDAPDLVSELLRLTTRLQAGSSQVRIPRSGSSHCDMAVSVAMAVAELDRVGVPVPLRTSSARFIRERGRSGELAAHNPGFGGFRPPRDGRGGPDFWR